MYFCSKILDTSLEHNWRVIKWNIRCRKDLDSEDRVWISLKATLFGKYICSEFLFESCLILQISAEKLSLDTAIIKVQLMRVFQTINHWNALILLNEADVYLKQRSKTDVARNKLVSVFLRKLKYCDNIIFFITNRVFNFDDAIVSRIHLVLKYPELDTNVRSKIWENMLDRVYTSKEGSLMTREGIKSLVITKLNGRQVDLLCDTFEDFFRWSNVL